MHRFIYKFFAFSQASYAIDPSTWLRYSLTDHTGAASGTDNIVGVNQTVQKNDEVEFAATSNGTFSRYDLDLVGRNWAPETSSGYPDPKQKIDNRFEFTLDSNKVPYLSHFINRRVLIEFVVDASSSMEMQPDEKATFEVDLGELLFDAAIVQAASVLSSPHTKKFFFAIAGFVRPSIARKIILKWSVYHKNAPDNKYAVMTYRAVMRMTSWAQQVKWEDPTSNLFPSVMPMQGYMSAPVGHNEL